MPSVVLTPKGVALILLLLLSHWAAAGNPFATSPLPLSAAPRLDLAGTALFLEDPTAARTLDEIARVGTGWRQTPRGVFNQGYNESAWWLKVELANPQGDRQQRLLEVAYAVLDFVDLYVVADGEVIASYRTGDDRVFGSRPLSTRFFVFPVSWEPHQQLTLYLRVASSSAVQVPLTLWQPERYTEHEVTGSTVQGLYLGAMAAITLYNLLLFLMLRERSYLYYVGFVGSISVFFLALSGQGYRYLWPDSVSWNSHAITLALAGTVLFGALFTRHFLGLRALSPLADRIILGFAAAGATMLGASLLLPYHLAIAILVPLGTLACLADIGAGILAWRRRQVAARIYLTAWGVFLLGSIILALSKVGLLPANLFTNHANQVGSVLEAVLLSFALAQRINTERRLRLTAQEATLTAQRRLTDELEHRVAARTAELATLNQQLQELSDTDALTGLRNRRYLEAAGAREWKHGARYRHALAVLLLDVDHFKQVNDRFGHAAGDHCLQVVAELLTRCMRLPSDIVARYGGEEFCLVLPETDAAGALVVAERIRQRIEHSEIAFDGSIIRLTVSIGVCARQPTIADSLECALREADQALYRAKSSGRNRVVPAATPVAAGRS